MLFLLCSLQWTPPQLIRKITTITLVSLGVLACFSVLKQYQPWVLTGVLFCDPESQFTWGQETTQTSLSVAVTSSGLAIPGSSPLWDGAPEL